MLLQKLKRPRAEMLHAPREGQTVAGRTRRGDTIQYTYLRREGLAEGIEVPKETGTSDQSAVWGYSASPRSLRVGLLSGRTRGACTNEVRIHRTAQTPYNGRRAPNSTPSFRFCHLATAKMTFARSLFKSLVIFSSLSAIQTSRALDVPLPQNAVSTSNVVYGNFLGISFELSFLDKYCKFPLSRSFPGFRSIHRH